MLAGLRAQNEEELRADFQQFYNLNIDDIGVAYSVRHAAVLAEQLPASSRVKMGASAKGLTLSEILLNLIEYDAHTLWWQRTKDGAKNKNVPRPVIDLAASERRLALEIDELKEALRAKRVEVIDNGR